MASKSGGGGHLSVTRALRSASRASGEQQAARSLTDLSVLGDGTGVDLQDVQASLLIGQLNIWKRPTSVSSCTDGTNQQEVEVAYGFYDPACQAAARRGPGCLVG